MTFLRYFLALVVVTLLALPAVTSQNLVNASTQMLIAALFACAFNLLCGQAGLLSFGHAAYFGIGTFATLHGMNALGGRGLLPTPLLPLLGGIAGLLVGAVAGWFATKRSGTYFAMITLALAELIHALAPHLKGWFGGEAGLSAMRMPSMGMDFGTPTQVYYLTLAWVLLSLSALYLLTLTPFGKLTVGLRENGVRLVFLGYDVHRLKVMTFAISTTFAGIAGGLQALGNESANYVVFEAGLSMSVVLNTYIGGVASFLGPIAGAAIMTLFAHALSDLTRSWLLYQGILFVLVMMFAPLGLAGLVNSLSLLIQKHGFIRLIPWAVTSLGSGVLLAAGTIMAIELTQRFMSSDYRNLVAQSPGAWLEVSLFGRLWTPDAFTTWLIPTLLFFWGYAFLRLTGSQLRRLKNAKAAHDSAGSLVPACNGELI